MQQLKIKLVPHGRVESNTETNVWFLLKENKYFQVDHALELTPEDEPEQFIILTFKMKDFKEVSYVVDSLMGLGLVYSDKV